MSIPENDLEKWVNISLQVCSLETYDLHLQNTAVRLANSVEMMILRLLLMVCTWVTSVSNLEKLLHLVMSVAKLESISEMLVSSLVMQCHRQLLGSRMGRLGNKMGKLGNMKVMSGNMKGTW